MMMMMMLYILFLFSKRVCTRGILSNEAFFFKNQKIINSINEQNYKNNPKKCDNFFLFEKKPKSKSKIDFPENQTLFFLFKK
jgi:hypothetical protein